MAARKDDLRATYLKECLNNTLWMTHLLSQTDQRPIQGVAYFFVTLAICLDDE